MDQMLVAGFVKAAGLEKAFAEFPDDVAAAIEQALRNVAAIKYPSDPAVEPWPPMRVGEGR